MSSTLLKRDMGKLFFWSDPHFFHKNVIRLCDRPFNNLAHMHAAMMENYNEVVGPQDTCIWVGDCFFMKNSTRVLEIMENLNGYKILVRGNHDFGMRKMTNMGFDLVTDELWLKLHDTYTVQVKHYPFRPSAFKQLKMNVLQRFLAKRVDLRYKHRRPKDNGQILIHGHTHQKKTFVGRSIHVGVDSNSFTPVSEDTIVNYIKGLK